MPSRSSIASASRIVPRLTPNCAASSGSEGKRPPVMYSLRCSSLRRDFATCMASGAGRLSCTAVCLVPTNLSDNYHFMDIVYRVKSFLLQRNQVGSAAIKPHSPQQSWLPVETSRRETPFFQAKTDPHPRSCCYPRRATWRLYPQQVARGRRQFQRLRSAMLAGDHPAPHACLRGTQCA